jgi:flagellar hook protein FlgE
MIIMQRAYQANAKTITTADEMIQKALQMRR